jgi:Ca2+-binding RTX toxin-like protein
MRPQIVFQIVLFGLFVLIFVSAVTAFAANLSVSESDIGYKSIAVTANDLKPVACSTLDLTIIIHGSGTITGTSGNDLIIGSAETDVINGLGGDDCILGADGDDSIDGGDSTDICIGGSGIDTFTNCETLIQ